MTSKLSLGLLAATLALLALAPAAQARPHRHRMMHHHHHHHHMMMHRR